MRRIGSEIFKQIILRSLLALVLISGFSIIGFAQGEESEELPQVIVPEQAMEQVVRRVLVWSFKPRNKATVIYLAEQRIKQSWLPKIKNIEFRLMSANEIEEKTLEVYFFTEPELLGKKYGIGFVFGDPACEYLGDYWHFRISEEKVRLWHYGGTSRGCVSSS